jgi:hypothetical protein
MKKSILFLAAIAVTGVIALSSCKKDDPAPVVTPTPTLYERVGGTTLVNDPRNAGAKIEQGRLTLRSVVDSAIYVIAADQSMAKFFPVLLGEVTAGNTTGFAALSRNFTDFLAVATGSKTTTYTGKSMKAAHDPATNNRMGEKATAADFDKFVGDIGVALGQNGVTDQKLINDLVALLNTTKADVVQK